VRGTVADVQLVIGRAAYSLRLRVADVVDALLGRRDRLTPARRLADYVGDSDFKATGEEFVRHFRELAELRPEDRVLDIGCGIGRMARVLVPILREPGSYDGFDIVSSGIAWCRERYQGTPAPFRFRHADLYNARYNPEGRGSAADYRFPYADESFDLVIATSVFTHLLEQTADHYLAEAARVLAPEGRLFATWFLLSEQHRLAPPAPFHDIDPGLPTAIADPAVAESAVAFDERWLLDRLRDHGLALRAIHRGTWAGRPGSSFQDIVIAERH
jgi:SAM-dependent methyltransferase